MAAVVSRQPQQPRAEGVSVSRWSSEPRRGGIKIDQCEHLDVEEMFVRLAGSAGSAERELWRRRIITECLPLADRIACRFVGRGEPSDDLRQVARIGLIHTVDRYEPTKGHFLAFAVPTIRGELRRHFRDTTWAVRVPRKVQETQLRMRGAVNVLSQRLRRAPTATELAEELDIDDEELSRSRAANSAYRPLSLDAPVAASGAATTETFGSTRGSEDSRYSQVEDLMMVRDAVAQLDPRRRAIIRMIYFECLTQREVAHRFGVSQVQISRLLNDALTRIKERVCVDGAVALCMIGPLLSAIP